MPIPLLKLLYRPVLEALADGEELSLSEIEQIVADRLGLSSEARKEQIKTGQRRLANRVGWSCNELRAHGLVEYRGRGIKKITKKGIDTVRRMQGTPGPLVLNVDAPDPLPDPGESTPEERIEAAATQLRAGLADDLIAQMSVGSLSPDGFERLVVNVLVAMGYGGNWKDAARAIGKSHDEGIDGVIDEDPLGLGRAYVQAKRWKQAVGGPEIRMFAGALLQKKSRRGIFITTSSFTPAARKAVEEIESRIVLIDGKRLAELMIEHDVGVLTASTYRVKRLDQAWFDDLG